jgi:Xaa-Pro aminopeptidase
MTTDIGWLVRQEPWHNESELSQQLAAADIDVVIARSGRNVMYLSGMRLPGTLGRHQDFVWSPRPALVVWPLDGSPTLVVNGFSHKLAAQSSWIDDIRTYTEYTESPWAVCIDRLKELGLDDGRIGVERQELNVDQWTELSEGLSAGELVDCTATLNRVRNIKTDREIELLRKSVEIQDKAHIEVFGDAEPGVTEEELHARMLEFMIERGAEWGHGMMQSDNTDITYGGEGPVPVEDGDVIRTDYVSYYRGYAANLSRMAVMGSPTDEQVEYYEDVRDIHRTILDEKIRPGVEAQEVYEFLKEQLRNHGYTDAASLAGHSTGIWWHQEEPIFHPGEETELQPGMVVCLEPIVDGFWHVQDQILVTEDGAELLSDEFDTSELFVMGQ